ncbi:MAG: FMN-binding protein, partial [bacterium]
MKSYWKILLYLVIIIVILGGGALFYMTRGLDSGRELPINNVDLSSLADGTYTGTYRGGRWTNTVKVTIKDHRISDIEIVDDVLFSQPAVLDKILGRVIDNQKVNVDVISEATVTSKAY